MKYSTFGELPVWQSAAEFALKVFDLTNRADLRGLGDTKHQLERAALSISNNIAEGNAGRPPSSYIPFTYPEARPLRHVQCFEFANRSRDSQISNLKFQISYRVPSTSQNSFTDGSNRSRTPRSKAQKSSPKRNVPGS
jgi:hypothetical protein